MAAPKSRPAKNKTAAKKRVSATKAAPRSKPSPEKAGVRLLSGGNPQIAKAEGDAPVQAYLAALPGWKREVATRLDALVVRAVPGVKKAVKWNSPFYGVEGQGYFLALHAFTKFMRVTYMFGQKLRPIPPGPSKDPNARYLDVYEDAVLDEAQFIAWAKQAAAIPGWDPGGSSRKSASARASKAATKKTPAQKTKAAPAAPTDASAQIDQRIRDLDDWRGETLAKVRALIRAADPEIVEEVKWRGTPVWSHDGIVCTGESYKEVVKLTFAHGAALPDPSKLFNASLEGGTRRAIDIRAGETLDARAFKALIRGAVARNTERAAAKKRAKKR